MATAGPSQPVPGGWHHKNSQLPENITFCLKSRAARDARDAEPSRRGIGCAIMHFECTIAGIALGRDLYIQDNQLLFQSGGGQCHDDHAAATKQGPCKLRGPCVRAGQKWSGRWESKTTPCTADEGFRALAGLLPDFRILLCRGIKRCIADS